MADTEQDCRIRAAALAALVRQGTPADAREAWTTATGDPDPAVRRRAAELTPLVPAPVPDPLLSMLGDAEPLVLEAACWAAGEVAWSGPHRENVVTGVIHAAAHRDPLVREAAVAALGALGDPEGLPAVLAACTDRPAVRRRAVLALAAFDGPEVEAALAAALGDRDWQTRQAAEDLL